MKAIYKKELRSYFTSMIGYVFIALLMFVIGIYFSAYNLGGGYPFLGDTLSTVVFMLLIFIPILTMRSLAEEQKNKTDQLLYTSPVSVPSIVTGKYFALVSVFAVPIILICIMPLILEQYGTVDMAQSYVAILGFFLLGCAYISIGLFLSSITESQIIAVVISFVVLLASYLISGISSFFSDTALTSLLAFSSLVLIVCAIYYIVAKSLIASGILFIVSEAILVGLYFFKSTMFEGAFAKMLNTLNLERSMTNMVSKGILDFTDIVFYLTVIALFLFFTVQSIQRKRWN